MKLDTKNEGDYVIMAALRGPDFIDPDDNDEPYDSCTVHVLKMLTTLVIRYFAETDSSAVLQGSPQEAIECWNKRSNETKMNVATIWNKQRHFKYHILAAIGRLKGKLDISDKLEEIQDYEKWLLATLNE